MALTATEIRAILETANYWDEGEWWSATGVGD